MPLAEKKQKKRRYHKISKTWKIEFLNNLIQNNSAKYCKA